MVWGRLSVNQTGVHMFRLVYKTQDWLAECVQSYHVNCQ